jgi:MFS family permease
LVFGDWLGRRKSIMLGATVMVIGVIIQVTAFKGHVPLAQFCVGRVVTGVGNGMNTSTIPTYQAECSRSTNRGLLICIEGSTVAIGTLISYWIDFGASYGSPDLTWRFPIAFQIVFGLLIIVGMFFLPESPRWLFIQERYEEGETIIAALAAQEISHPDVQLQKTIILDSIRAYVLRLHPDTWNFEWRSVDPTILTFIVLVKQPSPRRCLLSSRAERRNISDVCYSDPLLNFSNRLADVMLSYITFQFFSRNLSTKRISCQ